MGVPTVLVGDVVTVVATLTLEPRGVESDPVSGRRKQAVLPSSCHAPLLPYHKPESWVLALCAFERVRARVGGEGGGEGQGEGWGEGQGQGYGQG